MGNMIDLSKSARILLRIKASDLSISRLWESLREKRKLTKNEPGQVISLDRPVKITL